MIIPNIWENKKMLQTTNLKWMMTGATPISVVNSFRMIAEIFQYI